MGNTLCDIYDTSCKLAPYTLHTLGFFAKLLLYKQTASTQKLHNILWSKCIVCYIYHAHKGIGEMGSRGTICWRKWVWKWEVGGGNEAHKEDNRKASGNRCNPNTHMNSVRPPISCELSKASRFWLLAKIMLQGSHFHQKTANLQCKIGWCFPVDLMSQPAAAVSDPQASIFYCIGKKISPPFPYPPSSTPPHLCSSLNDGWLEGR